MNKALCTLLAASLLHLSASAQIKKGAVLLGGTISGYTQKTTNNGSTNNFRQKGLLINPAVGIATKENRIWGVNAGYGSSKTFGDNINTPRSKTTQGGIFHRRYLPLGKGFYVFGEGAINYSVQKNTFQAPNPNYQTVQQTNTSLYLYPGITYAVGERFLLEASINNLLSAGYSSNKEAYNDGTVTGSRKTNGFSFSSNVGTSAPLSVGFRFLLN
jgi:hypothetical protein